MGRRFQSETALCSSGIYGMGNPRKACTNCRIQRRRSSSSHLLTAPSYQTTITSSARDNRHGHLACSPYTCCPHQHVHRRHRRLLGLQLHTARLGCSHPVRKRIIRHFPGANPVRKRIVVESGCAARHVFARCTLGCHGAAIRRRCCWPAGRRGRWSSGGLKRKRKGNVRKKDNEAT